MGFNEFYVAVLNKTASVVLLLGEWVATTWTPERREIHVRVYDSDGFPWDFSTTLEPRSPEGYAFVEFSLPENLTFPIAVTAQCGCPLVWLVVPPNDERHVQGNRTLVEHHKREVTVHYDDQNDILNNPPLYDVETFVFNESLVHWNLDREFNHRGNVSLYSPNDRRLRYWELEGRQEVHGEYDDGFLPLDLGNWTLELEGRGWFTLHMDIYTAVADWPTVLAAHQA